MQKLFLSLTVLSCLFGQTVAASNLISLPREGSGGTTGYIYSSEPFAQIGTFAADPAAFDAVWHPTASKFYVFTKSSTKSITVFNGSAPFAERSSTNNIPNISAARISPDGRRLYVLSGALRIFDTFNDQEVVGINTGGRPIDVDFSLDSSRAFILNDNGSVVAIDTTTNQIVSTLSLANNPNSLMVGPTGFIYVTTSSAVLEIDGRASLATVGNPIGITGVNCTRIQFVPDGSRFVTACQSGGTTNIYSIETLARTLSQTTSSFVADRLRVISNTSALLSVPTSNTVFRVGLVPPLAAPIQLEVAGLGAVSGGRSLAVSDQIPTANYLFLDGPNSISRVNVGTNTISSTLTQPTFIGNLVFTGPSASGVAFSLIAITPQQSIVASQQGRPLVVRALDSQSRPINGLTINFSSENSQVQLSAGAAVTNKDGYASVGVSAPSITGTYTVAASSSGSQGQTFTLNVTGGSSGGNNGGGTGTEPIQILSGNGQLMFGQLFAPEMLRVIVRDGSGRPLTGATVTWQILSGDGTLTNAQTTTDANGTTENRFGSVLFFNDGFTPLKLTVVRATSTTGFVDFFLTAYPEYGILGNQVLTTSPPAIELISPPAGSVIRIQAGTPVAGAIRARITSQALVNQSRPIPNIAMFVPQEFITPDAITGQCSSDSLSNGQGEVSCNLAGGSRLGTGSIKVCVGNCQSPGRQLEFQIEVVPGTAAQFQKVQGDNQSGGPGTLTPLALRAAVTDSFGNRLAGVQVRVEIIQGEATLEQVFNTTNQQGEFSFLVRFGSTPGNVVIRTSAGTATTTWTLTNNVSVGNFTKVGGDNQTSVILRPFATPLTVQLFDAQGRPISGAAVTFSITNGNATLSASSVPTNAQGQASVTVTAGNVAGPISITATVLGRSVSFALTAVPPGPTITRVVNAASFAPGLAPCGLATIFGSNIAPSLNGSVSGNSFVGAYPYTLNNVRVEINNRPAPIVSLSNIAGQEQATIQTPCELQAGQATVRMLIGEGSGTFTTTVGLVQPGVFETKDSTGRNIGVIIKSDGTYMTLENPVVRGERVIGFFTGLGQLLVPTVTNIPGAYNNSSNVAAQFIVGVNNEGVPVQSATMAPGMVGIYISVFDIPAETTPGANRPYGVAAVGADGVVAGSNASVIHIR